MPALLVWDRLRPDPVGDDTAEALRCEIRDPLWMLARQYQMRELAGSDAGSVSIAHTVTKVSPIARWATDGGSVSPVPPEVPLDSLVERVAAPFDLQLRLETGREWLRMLRDANKRAAATAFLRERTLLIAHVAASFAPDDPRVTALANDEYARMLDAVAGRMLDGEALFRELANRPASSFLSGADPEVDALGLGWRTWVQQLVGGAEAAWTPSRLTYSFRVATTGATGEPRCLAATDHDGRGIDWTSFDHVACPPALAPAPAVIDEQQHAFVPSRIRFPGMPVARWWELEPAHVDLGSLQTATTDTGALLLAQFALLYSTDWLGISLPVSRGSLAQITQLDVTDVFGVTSTLPDLHAAVAPKFRMFRIHGDGVLDGLVVPHAPARRTQSAALEEVQLVRDEIANLAWAIESRVSNGVADSTDGRTSAFAVEAHLRAAAGAATPEHPLQQNDAHLQYRLATDVLPHMVPFTPVAGDNGLVLRRSAIPRMIDGQPITRIRGRTQLVRMPPRYQIDVSALPPSGVTIRGVWRRARSSDGRTHTWFAYERTPAARAAAVGLVFDQLVGRSSVGAK
jgi:hypothetical protein